MRKKKAEVLATVLAVISVTLVTAQDSIHETNPQTKQLDEIPSQELWQSFEAVGTARDCKKQQQGVIFDDGPDPGSEACFGGTCGTTDLETLSSANGSPSVARCASGSCSGTKGGGRKYDGYRVYRIDASDVSSLANLVQEFNVSQSITPDVTPEQVTLWDNAGAGYRFAYIMTPPSKIPEFEEYYKKRSSGYPPNVHIQDVGSLISHVTRDVKAVEKMDWKEYHSFATIDRFLTEKATKGNSAQLEVIGYSWEGRPIKVLKLVTNRDADRAIFIEGGMHAREWISPAVVTYIINEFGNSYCKNKNVVDMFQWYFLPLMNPDGYEYSRNVDRLWRKTRSFHGNQFGCRGVDPNRNFNVHWMTGGNTDPCSCIYAGPHPESEKCVIAVRDYVNKVKNSGVKIVGYYSIHSHGQYWLHPPGWTADDIPGLENMQRVSKVAVDAMKKVQGTEYIVGTAAKLLPPPSSGASDDWAFAVAKIPFVFTPELRDNGTYGFLLPPEEIISTGQEMLAGLLASAIEIQAILDNEMSSVNGSAEERQLSPGTGTGVGNATKFQIVEVHKGVQGGKVTSTPRPATPSSTQSSKSAADVTCTGRPSSEPHDSYNAASTLATSTVKPHESGLMADSAIKAYPCVLLECNLDDRPSRTQENQTVQPGDGKVKAKERLFLQKSGVQQQQDEQLDSEENYAKTVIDPPKETSQADVHLDEQRRTSLFNAEGSMERAPQLAHAPGLPDAPPLLKRTTTTDAPSEWTLFKFTFNADGDKNKDGITKVAPLMGLTSKVQPPRLASTKSQARTTTLDLPRDEEFENFGMKTPFKSYNAHQLSFKSSADFAKFYNSKRMKSRI